MSIGSILKTGTQHIGRQIGRQLALQSKTLAPAQLTHLNAPERDQFEALLHHHHKALDQATLQDRSAYLEALQHTDLRTYQDYLERKALQFLTEAGVRPSILQHELREELLYADHIRNNYTYFEQQHQQWQKLAGQSTKKPSTALVQLENEAHAFLAVDRSLLNILQFQPRKSCQHQPKRSQTTRLSIPRQASEDSVQENQPRCCEPQQSQVLQPYPR